MGRERRNEIGERREARNDRRISSAVNGREEKKKMEKKEKGEKRERETWEGTDKRGAVALNARDERVELDQFSPSDAIVPVNSEPSSNESANVYRNHK